MSKRTKTSIVIIAAVIVIIVCLCAVLVLPGRNHKANHETITQAYENLLEESSLEGERKSQICYGSSEDIMVTESVIVQQTEEPFAILSTMTMETWDPGSSYQEKSKTKLDFYCEGSRDKSLHMYMREKNTEPGGEWIDYGKTDTRIETVVASYYREPASSGSFDMLGNLRQCMKAAAESESITRKGNEYSVVIPDDRALICAIAVNQGLQNILASNGIDFDDLLSADESKMGEIAKSIELVIEINEDKMLPSGYKLDFTKTLEIMPGLFETESDNLGSLVINVAVNNYNAVSELDYTNYGGEEAFRKALVNAKTENEVYEQLVEKEYHLKLESWDFLLSQKDGSLSQKTLDRLAEMFEPEISMGNNASAFNPNTLFCYFSSEYDKPEEMDLEQFLRYYPAFSECFEWTEEQEKKLLDSAGWKQTFVDMKMIDTPTPVRLFDPQELNKGLEYYAGIRIQDIPTWQEGRYVPEIDRYLNTTSDAGGAIFVPAAGSKENGKVVLQSAPDGEGSESVLTLQEKDGRYRILSYRIKKAE